MTQLDLFNDPWILTRDHIPNEAGEYLACSVDNPKVSGTIPVKVVRRVSRFWHTHWMPAPNLPTSNKGMHHEYSSND